MTELPRAAAGPTNSLVDVAGLRVGHHHTIGGGWLTGTTVVLTDDDGLVGGVDVRGGGPGTRETDLLDPRAANEAVHAFALSGGSAFGLAAADGVMQRLEARGLGVQVQAPAADGSSSAPPAVVPIVPTAVIFDLGRGGEVANRPDAAFGAAAHDAALAEGGDRVVTGTVGAGAGAVAGGLKGGVGTASVVLADGATVAALVVVNPAGSAVDPATGALYGARCGLAGEFDHLSVPEPEELAAHLAAVSAVSPTLNTTLAVVATDATLPKARCSKLASIGHDGLARAIRPVHTLADGDTVFAVSTGRRPTPDLPGLHQLLHLAGDCVSRAVVHAMLDATSVTTPVGTWSSYADRFPSALRGGPSAPPGASTRSEP